MRRMLPRDAPAVSISEARILWRPVTGRTLLPPAFSRASQKVRDFARTSEHLLVPRKRRSRICQESINVRFWRQLRRSGRSPGRRSQFPRARLGLACRVTGGCERRGGTPNAALRISPGIERGSSRVGLRGNGAQKSTHQHCMFYDWEILFSSLR